MDKILWLILAAGIYLLPLHAAKADDHCSLFGLNMAVVCDLFDGESKPAVVRDPQNAGGDRPGHETGGRDNDSGGDTGGDGDNSDGGDGNGDGHDHGDDDGDRHDHGKGDHSAGKGKGHDKGKGHY